MINAERNKKKKIGEKFRIPPLIINVKKMLNVLPAQLNQCLVYRLYVRSICFTHLHETVQQS